MVEIGPTLVDYSIYEAERTDDFSAILLREAELLVSTQGELERHRKQHGIDSPPTIQVGESEIGIELGFSVSVTPIGESGKREETHEFSTITGEELVTDERAEEAILEGIAASHTMIAYLLGYKRYLDNKLADIYEDSVDRDEMSWKMTWKKLKDSVASSDKGVISEIADFFDNLVAIEYQENFDRTDQFRGLGARSDTSARIFYTVFEPHLKRATQHQGRDNWSG
jgi:hypothetical protein